MGPSKSTIAVNVLVHSIFVRLIAIFAANSHCGPTLPQVIKKDRHSDTYPTGPIRQTVLCFARIVRSE
eukprot:839373-Prymnesium_polylepis.1